MNKMVDQSIGLDDKYTRSEGRVFMTGLQALVRLPMAQIRRDRAAGLNTGVFISGYRGSPLGGFDQQLWQAKNYLKAHDIHFQPGVNEDLAATAVWGSQQVGLSPGANRDGVVGIWYGKGPGVDRSGDVFKHGNAAGTSKHGGVLCLAGDDHGAKSSTLPHQSDHSFMSAVIPMLYPSSIHDFIGMGLLGIAMSRYSGCWVGMKLISDTVETTAAVDVGHEQREFIIPSDFELPPDGVHLRWPDDRWSQDHRLQNYKGYAAIAFARANRVDQVVIDSNTPRLGVVASGKAYEVLRQALRELGLDTIANEIGLRIYKVGMPWPLEPEGIRHFSEGLEEVLIVEERREIIENQIKQQLYNWRADVRPRVVGKFDHEDKPMLPLDQELTVGIVGRALASRLLHLDLPQALHERIDARLHELERMEAAVQAHVPPSNRTPYFCSGCPHNTSTKVPEGSRALAGIGCHFMVQWMDRSTETFTQMGGEGVPWTGTAPFTDEKHIFANLGDGTYFHSGLLAIRQSVSSGVNITYKVLYNDAVAMTGGQAVDGPLSVPQVTHQLKQENVKRIWLVSDDPARFDPKSLAPGTIVRHRDFLDQVQREARETEGCTAIVYDQGCAAEKRRKRRRGLIPDPPKRVFINSDVCEGCGDCSVQSNCLSVEPLETELGRKRRINQSSCNKDYSCLKGFCPSFVTIEGGSVRKVASSVVLEVDSVPAPVVPDLGTQPFNIAIAGIGGTGVLTIGAVLGMAAHLEGTASIILDISGLAQKGGAVLSHVRLARKKEDVTLPRIVTGGADVLLAADGVVAASKDGVGLCSTARTYAIVNSHLTPVADFTRRRDLDFHAFAVADTIRKHVRPDATFVDFNQIAEAAIGDTIATNIMMLGMAFQKGLIPVAAESIERAIVLNAVSVKANQQAFRWGRLIAADPERVADLLAPALGIVKPVKERDLNDLIAHRSRLLVAYQGEALARRYRALVDRVRKAADAQDLDERLPRAAAKYWYKLLAYKDEYEVARLFTDGAFEREVGEHFEGDFRLRFNLAPPFLPGRAPDGRPKKRAFGKWMLPVFRTLVRFRFLRGTPLDPFGYSADRRAERALIREYADTVDHVLKGLTPQTADIALALIALPEDIRGYGPVKQASIAAAALRREELLARFGEPPSAFAEAAE